MKKHPILFGILILFAVVYASSLITMRRSPAAAPQLSQAAARPERTAEERTAEMARSLVANAMPDATVESRYDKENNLVFIDISSAGLDGEFVRQAKNGNPDYVEGWSSVAENVVSIQKSLQKLFNGMEMEDTVVVLNILNADNTDEVLISAANGIIGYDVVNDIDLLNQGSEGSSTS